MVSDTVTFNTTLKEGNFMNLVGVLVLSAYVITTHMLCCLHVLISDSG